MKIILFLLIPFTLFSQVRDPRNDQFNYAPGELIVKLRDDVDAGIKYKSTSKGISHTSVSKDIGLLLNLGSKIDKYEALFSEEAVQRSLALKEDARTKRLVSKKSNQIYQGPDYDYSLNNIFILKLKDKGENIIELVDQLKANPNVEYAEPNYIFSVNDFTVDSDIIYNKDLPLSSTTTSTTPNDPLYSQQSNITQANIDDVWNEYTTGDGSQIVAILDTGVDYTHPDLEANIWINQAELNGVAGYDDDGNGFVDDIRGWDFINNDNTPFDDNMHGTHVAGIVGAVGGNGIGIAGAAWNVKLMAIKVFQSNGTGNATTIAQGVTYATDNGATIQNMSFGSYAESQTLKAALETAYASSILVGAAGNNKICIGPGECPDGKPSAPHYPGAYTYVLGVEDVNGEYDNYDQDGPVFSGYSNYLNYEVKAAGSAIMSTVPNGGYRTLTGTSMATPLVAGALALYKETKPDDSIELIFGSLINTSEDEIGIDIKAAIEAVPTPILRVLQVEQNDNIEGQNNNGFFEPGERINLIPTIKNYWGPTNDFYVGISYESPEENLTIITPEINVGGISAYGTFKNQETPLVIQLNENLNHGMLIRLKFTLSIDVDGTRETLSEKNYDLRITNALILDGYLTTDLHLKANKEYLLTQNLIITNNSTLTIDPGVTLKLTRDIIVDAGSRIIANGTKDSIINFVPADNQSRWGDLSFNSGDNLAESSLKFIKFSQGGTINPPQNSPKIILEDIQIYDGSVQTNSRLFSSYGKRINIVDSYVEAPLYKPGNEGNGYGDQFNQNSSGYLLHSVRVRHIWHSSSSHGYLENVDSDPPNSSFLNLYCERSPIANNEHPIYGARNSIGVFTMPSKVYLGTGNINKLKEITSDFYTSDNNRIGQLDFSTTMLYPSDVPHGHVWKVLVNGKDAQDEYDEIDPLGVGTHEFKVYFNRTMDTSMPPKISYGVREPYVQKQITEAGNWSEDGKIYTVSHNINIGAADGINRIRVEGARDLDNFYIPVEDYRFNFLLQSAGSASTGFEATPGLGEIDLAWEEPSDELLDDVLGYNVYRYVSDGDGGFTEPAKINTTLVTDVNYTDYNVVRDTQYFYKYKILRTSFEETDFSNAVSASLLTASLGDSNGDASVNVLDVVNTVNYILGTNPTPFVDYATDVNSDSAINVLDIVGIVNLILNPSTSSVRVNGSPINYYSNKATSKAKFYWDKNDLYLVNQESIGGIQLAFAEGFEYVLNQDINGFETLKYQQDKEEMLLLFALNENELKPGKHKILTKTSLNSDLSKAVIASKSGTPIDIEIYDIPLEIIKSPEQTDSMKILSFAPNPTDGPLDLYYYLPETVDQISVHVYDIYGNIVYKTSDLKNTSGYSHKELDLSHLNSGIYLLSLSEGRNKRTIKIIIK